MQAQDYQEKLMRFKSALQEAVGPSENPEVTYTRDPRIVMQYGPSAVVCSLYTESSGHDKYVIWVNQFQEVEFIRLLTEGDKL